MGRWTVRRCIYSTTASIATARVRRYSTSGALGVFGVAAGFGAARREGQAPVRSAEFGVRSGKRRGETGDPIPSPEPRAPSP
jgi:hypothetical protein